MAIAHLPVVVVFLSDFDNEIVRLAVFKPNEIELMGTGLAGMPDLVEIGFKDRAGQAYEDISENELVIKRVSYPKDITGTASFLASDDSDYMTGHALVMDGGHTIFPV